MPCLPQYLITEYTAQLARVNEQISHVDEQIASAGGGHYEVEEYSFNSGEGSQRTKRRSLGDLQSTLDMLEAKKLRIMRKLYGHSLVNFNLRRR